VFIFGKKKVFIFFTLLWCSGVYVTKAMEQEEPALKRRKTEEQVISAIEKKKEGHISHFETLPSELKAYIISFLVNANRVEEALKSIKRLSVTSKEFYSLINDPQVLGRLMKGISKRFAGQLADESFHAVRTQDKKLMVFCLNAGADVNQANEYGRTILAIAAYNNDTDIVKLLLNAKADVNKADKDGDTPLSIASIYDLKEIVELLLVSGADPNLADNKGYTPLSMAASLGYEEIAELLSKFRVLSRLAELL
jgi:hypothetical protein